MMGIKKIARPINKAKNTFLKWLKDNKAHYVDEYCGSNKNGWIYYKYVCAFIGKSLYTVYFKFHSVDNLPTIDYSDSENNYKNLTIEEFLELFKK